MLGSVQDVPEVWVVVSVRTYFPFPKPRNGYQLNFVQI